MSEKRTPKIFINAQMPEPKKIPPMPPVNKTSSDKKQPDKKKP